MVPLIGSCLLILLIGTIHTCLHTSIVTYTCIYMYIHEYIHICMHNSFEPDYLYACTSSWSSQYFKGPVPEEAMVGKYHCTWRSIEGAAAGSEMTWLLVFLPFKVATEGLLAVVMSQKLRFLAVGAGDRNRWLGLFNSPPVGSFGRKLALVTTLFTPWPTTTPSDGFPLFLERSRIKSSFCFSWNTWSFFILSISASNAFTVRWSSLTVSSAPFLFDSGVKQFPAKKEDLGFRFSFGWIEDGGDNRDVTEDGVGEQFAAKDCAWRVRTFCCWRASCTRNSLFSFCNSSNSLAWSASDSGNCCISSLVSHACNCIRWQEILFTNSIYNRDKNCFLVQGKTFENGKHWNHSHHFVSYILKNQLA